MGGTREHLVHLMKITIGAIADALRKPEDETFKTVWCNPSSSLYSGLSLTSLFSLADHETLTLNHFLLGHSNSLLNILPSEPTLERETYGVAGTKGSGVSSTHMHQLSHA